MVVPQPEAVTITASTSAFVHWSTERLARASASACLPMCWVSEPQQASSPETTTSKPSRVSRRIVAALMPGSSTLCTQPISSATRPLFSATAGYVPGWPRRSGVGMRFGTRPSSAAMRVAPKDFANGANGAASLAPISDRRNSMGRGMVKASTLRSRRSNSGLLYVSSTWARASSTRCM